MNLIKRWRVKRALDKAKKLEQQKEQYTVEKLEKEDSEFKSEARGLKSLLSRFPAKSKKTTKKKTTK